MTEPLQPLLNKFHRRRHDDGPAAEADGQEPGRRYVDLETVRKEKQGGFSRGLNLEPGSDDDGWKVTPPVTLADGTRLQLYKDGEALAAAFEAVQRAKRRIFVEVYIWSHDETGEAFADLLGEKAARGVDVYAMYDGFGCLLSDRSMFEKMRRRGVKVLEFHPIRPWENRHSWRPFNRDHRKLLVVDDDTAGLGGLNLGNRYAGTWVAKVKKLDVDMLWRDAAVGIVGPGARTFVKAFARSWRYARHRGPVSHTQWFGGLNLPSPGKGRRLGKASSPAKVLRALQTPGRPGDVMGDGHDLACLATAPTLASPLRPFLYRLLRDARRSISLTMAYFAPDDALIEALIAASRRGARVRLMLAGRTDAPVVVWAGRAFYGRLMDAGVTVYERQGIMLHQKSIVIDGEVSLLGSTNLDYRSIEFNLEMSAIVRNPAFAGQLEALFEHDVQFSEKIDPEAWRQRPYRDRLVQWAVSRLRYVL